jgi:hypothetical protein
MSLRLLEPVNYAGTAGVLLVRGLQWELNNAFIAEDWNRVRRLDQSCSALIEKVILANNGDACAIAEALSELKGVYASLIVRCRRELAAMAY